MEKLMGVVGKDVVVSTLVVKTLILWGECNPYGRSMACWEGII